MTLLMIPALVAALSAAGEVPLQQPHAERPQLATLCFLQGEVVSGMNKICYYDCLGSLTAITIGAVKLCPLTIND